MSERGEGRSIMSDNTSERAGIKGVSRGPVLAINAVDAIRFDGLFREETV